MIKRILLYIVVPLLALEVLLRLLVNVVPFELRNLILTKYTTGTSGIYFNDPEYALNILKPNFTQNAFYDDYWWRHHANNIGIRDDRDIDKADVVVLGDSLVYGHGVELEGTLAYQLERISGLRVANLGVQGDYPLNEYIRLKRLGLFLQPKLVVFCINGKQDELDFSVYKPTKEKVQQLVAAAPPDYSLGVAHSDYLLRYQQPMTIKRFFADSLVFRVGILLKEMWPPPARPRRSSGGQSSPPKSFNYDPLITDILTDANALCQKNGARLMVVFMWEPKHSRLNAFSKKICVAQNIPFIDLARDATLRDDIHKRFRYFLPHDGHFSPEGNRYVASTILQFLKQQGLL